VVLIVVNLDIYRALNPYFFGVLKVTEAKEPNNGNRVKIDNISCLT